MKEKINEEVSVVMYYSAKQKIAVPHILNWRNRTYPLDKTGYYHPFMEGRDKQHVFELCDKQGSIWFRLRLNSSNLHWTLEAIHDGNPT